MEYNLQRFVDAQQDMYEVALQEIQEGRKQSHWIWFIFPQVKGLGHSWHSEYYGLDGVEEAKAYLAHPVLSSRLREICKALLTHKGQNITGIMGGEIDTLKLHSSMDIFNEASPSDVFEEVLDTFYHYESEKRNNTGSGTILGAVVGDMVGSMYEFCNVKTTDFEMFPSGCGPTDDSVMTLAVAKWLMEDKAHTHQTLVRQLQTMGRKYPDAGYGGHFLHWIFEEYPKPYGSWGNGSGMRVSPVGLYASTLDEAMRLAKISAEVTHNDPEGIKGAQAIACCIFLSRLGKTKDEVRAFVENTFKYDLSRSIDEIRPSYHFDVSCQGSVPVAIRAFLDGNDFEEVIRLAISVGGDSDTIGAMAGAIASCVYPIPEQIRVETRKRMPQDLRDTNDAFLDFVKNRPAPIYIDPISKREFPKHGVLFRLNQSIFRKSSKEKTIDRIKGTMFGQAIGDALGLGTEGMTDEDMNWKYPDGLTSYSQIYQDRHRKRWKIGDWTDDTDMMLCIARAFIEDGGANLTHIAQNFKDWASGEPMGIGENTYKVLMIGDYVEKPQAVAKKIWEMGRKQSAPNGGVMRTSIVGLIPDNVEEVAKNVCQLTHYDPRCVASCVIISKIIHALVYDDQEYSPEEIIEMGLPYTSEIEHYVEAAMQYDLDAIELQNDNSMGYTMKTLAAALWALWHCNTFEDGLLAVANAGGDADTNAAVACAVLGAKFGYKSIPQEYIDGLAYRDELEKMTKEFLNKFID